MASANGQWLQLGVIVSAHGIRGQFRVKPFTAEPLDIASYGPVKLDNGSEMPLKAVSVAKGLVLCSSPDIRDRNTAEALKGQTLSVQRHLLPPPDEDQIYHADLLGVEVYDSSGGHRGSIIGMYDFGAGDIAEVRHPETQKTEMLPFYQPFLKELDIEGRRVIIDGGTD